jgi:hypothetical protein
MPTALLLDEYLTVRPDTARTLNRILSNSLKQPRGTMSWPSLNGSATTTVHEKASAFARSSNIGGSFFESTPNGSGQSHGERKWVMYV